MVSCTSWIEVELAISGPDGEKWCKLINQFETRRRLNKLEECELSFVPHTEEWFKRCEQERLAQLRYESTSEWISFSEEKRKVLRDRERKHRYRMYGMGAYLEDPREVNLS